MGEGILGNRTAQFLHIQLWQIDPVNTDRTVFFRREKKPVPIQDEDILAGTVTGEAAHHLVCRKNGFAAAGLQMNPDQFRALTDTVGIDAVTEHEGHITVLLAVRHLPDNRPWFIQALHRNTKAGAVSHMVSAHTVSGGPIQPGGNFFDWLCLVAEIRVWGQAHMLRRFPFIGSIWICRFRHQPQIFPNRIICPSQIQQHRFFGGVLDGHRLCLDIIIAVFGVNAVMHDIFGQLAIGINMESGGWINPAITRGETITVIADHHDAILVFGPGHYRILITGNLDGQIRGTVRFRNGIPFCVRFPEIQHAVIVQDILKFFRVTDIPAGFRIGIFVIAVLEVFTNHNISRHMSIMIYFDFKGDPVVSTVVIFFNCGADLFPNPIFFRAVPAGTGKGTANSNRHHQDAGDEGIQGGFRLLCDQHHTLFQGFLGAQHSGSRQHQAAGIPPYAGHTDECPAVGRPFRFAQRLDGSFIACQLRVPFAQHRRHPHQGIVPMEHQAHAPQHGPDMVTLAVVAHFMRDDMTPHLRI